MHISANPSRRTLQSLQTDCNCKNISIPTIQSGPVISPSPPNTLCRDTVANRDLHQLDYLPYSSPSNCSPSLRNWKIIKCGVTSYTRPTETIKNVVRTSDLNKKALRIATLATRRGHRPVVLRDARPEYPYHNNGEEGK
jgi:hypothetical protein